MSNRDSEHNGASDTPLAQVLALSELTLKPSSSDDAAAPAIGALSGASNPLHHVKTQLTVCVGSAVISVGELLAAKESQVLRLDRRIEQSVDIVLEGQVVARGELVAVGEHFGVRITELPVPLNV